MSGILLFPAWVRGRIELRRKTKALQEAEVDLERLRQALDKAARRVGTSSDIPAEESPPMGDADGTPLMRQYRDIKQAYRDAILFPCRRFL